MLKNKRVVIIGGSSGIGLATAKSAAEQGAHVIIAGRSEDKLARAKTQINHSIETHVVDASDEKAIEKFFHQIKPLDHLLTPGSSVNFSPFLTQTVQNAHKNFVIARK